MVSRNVILEISPATYKGGIMLTNKIHQYQRVKIKRLSVCFHSTVSCTFLGDDEYHQSAKKSVRMESAQTYIEHNLSF